MIFNVHLDYYSVSALVNLITSIGLGTFVYFVNKKGAANIGFAAFAFSAALWSFGYFMWQISGSNETALFWSRMLMIGAVFAPAAYYHFVLALLGKLPSRRKFLLLGYGIFTIFALLDFTPYFVKSVGRALQFEFWPHPGPVFHLFLALWFFYLILTAILLVKSLRDRATDITLKQQIKFVLGAMVIAFFGGSTNYFLWYHIPIPPYGNILVSLYVIIIAYAILKHKLFDFKVVAAELFVITLWGFIFTRLLISETLHDQITNGILFLATIVIGILMIRSIRKEVATRERIEALADELAIANGRLKELDRQKSEFVSIASHQLRSPLTAIKGYSSMVLEGSFGDIPAQSREAINRIFESSQRLVVIIEDFLNISRIEQGRMQYEFSSVPLDNIIKEVQKEMEANIKRAGLTLEYRELSPGPFIVTADSGKIRQVVTNIIDNAIKYTPQGGITIKIRKDEERHKVLLEVSDTGIGIPADVMPRLFEKFSRAEDAGKTNIMGTGLGLFVAKEIMKAHRGNIWVDSEGKGKGSTFYLEFMGE